MTKTEHIKAILDWYKLVLTSSMGAVFLLLLYQIQYPEKATHALNIGYLSFLLIFALTSWFYSKKAQQLEYAEIDVNEVESQENIKKAWWHFWK